MSDEPQRLFLAIALDADVRAALATHLETTAPLPGRAVPVENWHLTLRFLGKSPPDQRDRFLHHLEERVGGGPFPLRFDGLGAFPKPARATVAWLGVSAGRERVEELGAAAEEAAMLAGFFPEERPFHPHVTLARIRPPEDLTGLAASFSVFSGRLRVDRVTLYQSVLTRGPAEYRIVDEVPL